MDKIAVEGGTQLKGTVRISGAKNAVLPVLAATLLTQGRNIIQGVPKVRDVATMIKLLEDLGVEVESYHNEKIILDTSRADNPEAPYDLVSTMRASCLVLGPLLARLGKARVSLPGGCAIESDPSIYMLKGWKRWEQKSHWSMAMFTARPIVLRGYNFTLIRFR